VRRVCVFCGASSGRRPVYADAARGFGGAVAARGLGLVYGGGRVGLMGAVADGALAAGGEVVGVIPQALVELMEQLTWSQLGLHAKPVGLLDVEGFWHPLIALARHATDEGFVRESDLGAIAVGDEPGALLDRLEGLEREERPRPKWTSPPGP
jgi:predicted Rossmann-fold nucleotide-binding protein